MHTRLSGANTSEDIRDVVLGLSSIDYVRFLDAFASSCRSGVAGAASSGQLHHQR